MIRAATIEDVDRIVEMGVRFVAQTDYHQVFEPSPEKIASTVENLLKSDNAAIFVSGNGHGVNGMIIVVVFEHPWTGQTTASEMVWWVEPEARGVTGIKLLRTAEKWAAESGATQMQMVAPNVGVGDIYMRMGYAPIEMSFYRRL